MLNPALRTIYTCFPGGKHKVLTMSYDDGRLEDRRLVEIFNAHGIKGTFNLNSGRFSDSTRIPLSEYASLYASHEIACHTYLHPTIERYPMEQVTRQVLQDRYELEDITGAPVRGLAYTNGSYSKEIMELLPLLGIKYARVVPTTGDFGMPENFLAWRGTCHHNDNLLELGARFLDDARRLRFTAAGDRVYNPNAASVWLEVDGKKVEVPGGALVSL